VSFRALFSVLQGNPSGHTQLDDYTMQGHYAKKAYQTGVFFAMLVVEASVTSIHPLVMVISDGHF
jgi:hypothetical protein